MRCLALAAIRLYQWYVSPFKGFSCAYRVHTGRASCSAVGYRAFRRHGFAAGLALTRERTAKCGDLQRRLTSTPFMNRRRQQGFCEGCDVPSCDTPGCDGACDTWDLSDACDCCGCDSWGTRRKSKQEGRRSRGAVYKAE
ncbi:MAG: membrane protein insertion efficiency factor YidD [Pseudomonadota bacterium]|nr:membrane protein insertion efficiency factor YidD [Pseudomonadota bacterium]